MPDLAVDPEVEEDEADEGRDAGGDELVPPAVEGDVHLVIHDVGDPVVGGSETRRHQAELEELARVLRRRGHHHHGDVVPRAGPVPQRVADRLVPATCSPTGHFSTR